MSCNFLFGNTSSWPSLSLSLRRIFCMSSIFWRTASAVLTDNQWRNLFYQTLSCKNFKDYNLIYI